MANVAVLLVVLLLAWYVSSVIRRRVHGLVPKRGIGVASDLGALADKPRVRVKEVAALGPDRVHVILVPELSGSADLDLVVLLRADEFGYGQLQEWKSSEKSLAIVIPPAGRIVRLRSIDDLQPLTLRRLDDPG